MEELRLPIETGDKLPDEFFVQVARFWNRPATLRFFLYTYIGENGITGEQKDEAEKRAARTRELLEAASDELDLPATPAAAQSLLALVEGAAIKSRSAYRSLHPESPNGVPAAWTSINQLFVETPQTPHS